MPEKFFHRWLNSALQAFLFHTSFVCIFLTSSYSHCTKNKSGKVRHEYFSNSEPGSRYWPNFAKNPLALQFKACQYPNPHQTEFHNLKPAETLVKLLGA